ncbi:hypothetical protein ACFFIO_09550 [Citricoccus parietis]|uniref:Uncharacterized protein n=1 Tax=Citricoccus parietis TaxID=592307 RepID=A0ABV6F5E8_9MICC
MTTDKTGTDRLAAAYEQADKDNTDPAEHPAGTGVDRLAAALNTTTNEGN